MHDKIKSSDTFARLLAVENITVVRDGSSTASFDICARVLTLPNWDNFSTDVEGMMIGHEVGHALFTTEDLLVPLVKQPNMHSTLNVLEDVRIERLMCRKYPGLTKTMVAGYAELNAKDFFGVGTASPAELMVSHPSLIDRINLYYKVGADCGVQFTDSEMVLVERTNKTETIADVIALAEDVFKSMAEEHRAAGSSKAVEKKPAKANADDSRPMDGSVEGDQPQDVAGKNKPTHESDEDQEWHVAQTQIVFDNKMESAANTDVRFKYYTLYEQDATKIIIPYKQIMEDTKGMDASPHLDVGQFMTRTKAAVQYMLKEFEMRKSATVYKRQRISKSGQLDVGKLWSYKLKKELFRSITTVDKGKNHGMIFLLDWSSSMSGITQDTMQQVITLAMFCHQAQIPYQVFAFSSAYAGAAPVPAAGVTVTKKLASHGVLGSPFDTGTCAFLELFSSTMRGADFNIMARRMFDTRSLLRKRNYRQGGTPLNEALMALMTHIPRFTKQHAVEKMSLITLTDGSGELITPYDSSDDLYYDGDRHKCFLTDPVTRADYKFSVGAESQTAAIFAMMRDRFKITTVALHIVEMVSEYGYAIQANLPNAPGSTVNSLRSKCDAEINATGVFSIPGTVHDTALIIPSRSFVANAAAPMTASTVRNETAEWIAAQMVRAAASSKAGRVVLGKFVETIA